MSTLSILTLRNMAAVLAAAFISHPVVRAGTIAGDQAGGRYQTRRRRGPGLRRVEPSRGIQHDRRPSRARMR